MAFSRSYEFLLFYEEPGHAVSFSLCLTVVYRFCSSFVCAHCFVYSNFRRPHLTCLSLQVDANPYSFQQFSLEIETQNVFIHKLRSWRFKFTPKYYRVHTDNFNFKILWSELCRSGNVCNRLVWLLLSVYYQIILRYNSLACIR